MMKGDGFFEMTIYYVILKHSAIVGKKHVVRVNVDPCNYAQVGIIFIIRTLYNTYIS